MSAMTKTKAFRPESWGYACAAIRGYIHDAAGSSGITHLKTRVRIRPHQDDPNCALTTITLSYGGACARRRMEIMIDDAGMLDGDEYDCMVSTVANMLGELVVKFHESGNPPQKSGYPKLVDPNARYMINGITILNIDPDDIGVLAESASHDPPIAFLSAVDGKGRRWLWAEMRYPDESTNLHTELMEGMVINTVIPQEYRC